jgi:hypothetical protein
MDLSTEKTFASARWLVGSGFAVVFGLAVDAPLRAEDQEAAPSTAAIETSADASATEASKPRDGASRRAQKEKDKKATAPPPAAATTAYVAEQEIVCKNVEVLGSSIKRRVCGTPEQWEAARKKKSDAAQEGMRQMRERSTLVTRPLDTPAALGTLNH